MERIVLLSETNPLSANLFGYALNPAVQIDRNYAWLGFPPYPGHVAELGAPTLFGEYVTQLNAQCEALGRFLVIRDYNYADYVGSPFAWPLPRRSSLDAALQGAGTNEVLLIRHPVAQYLSLRSHDELVRAIDYRVFLEGYRRMLAVHAEAKRFKYEAVFVDFERQIRTLAAALDLTVDDSYRTRLAEVTWITGSEIAKTKGAAEPPKEIPSAAALGARELFRQDKNYVRICEECDYEI